MALQPGSQLGRYEVVGTLGEGGMGAVYRGRDPELGREVAVKLLLDDVASDPERLARFSREARVLASLNHPNVATLFGYERDDTTHFLVMELVEGPTLAEALEGGAMPIERAFHIFVKIAEGLAAAHEKGIVHRDLKPANVKLADASSSIGGGTDLVKVLDFGLAIEGDVGEVAVDHDSSTMIWAATQEAAILGTPAYMSPEQASGMAVDKRTDIWAFGICLFEAIVGKRPFAGADQQQLLSAILTSEPDWEALPEKTPKALRRLLRHCLAKEPRNRLHDIADVRLALRDMLDDPEDGSDTRPSSASRVPFIALAAVAVLSTCVALWSLFGPGGEAPEPRPVRRFEVDIGQAKPLYDWNIVSEIALSSDGSLLAYVADYGESSRLFIRRLDAIEAVEVTDSDHALSPFFSPDGRWVGYYAAGGPQGPNEIRKVPVDGGPSQYIVEAWPPSGATWLEDGSIVYPSITPFRAFANWDRSEELGLFRVDDTGGSPIRLTSADRARNGEFTHNRPVSLPKDGKLLFNVVRTGGRWRDEPDSEVSPDWNSRSSDLAVLDLEGGNYEVLLENASNATYSPSGHLLFMRNRQLWAVPFDPDRAVVNGAARIVREDLQAMVVPQANTPCALAGDGSAVFLPAAAVPPRQQRLVWVDRDGSVVPAEVPPTDRLQMPRVSPNGERILFIANGTTDDVWVHDRSSPGSRMRLTFDDHDDMTPIWLADSERFLFVERVADDTYGTRFVHHVLEHRADGSGTPRRWTREGFSPLRIPSQALPGGGHALFYEADSPATFWDIADSSRPKHERFVIQTEALETCPVISPDGRWIAFSARPHEDGTPQILVHAYPDIRGGRWQLTTEGGDHPLWSTDGTELFYRQGDAMMSVPVRTSPRFRAGQPSELFVGDFVGAENRDRQYDLEYPDGRRFLMIEDYQPPVQPTRLEYVENWTRELEELFPDG